jgi:hypothetical protein
MIENLTEKNVSAYMIMSYNNPQCVDIDEFEDDVKIPKYIKRLINRYSGAGELKERLILNHIILFYNVFEHDAATRILFLKIEKQDYSILKTFLTYLNYMPDEIELIDGENILNSDIPLCQDVVERLREL